MSESRDNKGRVGPGNNLRAVAVRTRAKVISRRLKSEFVRRYANERLSPDDPNSEVLGKERAQLKHLFVLMDIMQNPMEKAQDRIRAVEALADRKDGKPVTAIEISGPDGGPVETGTTVTDEQLLTPAQRLANALKSLGVLAQHGGLDAVGQTGGVGGDAAAGVPGATGSGGTGSGTAK